MRFRLEYGNMVTNDTTLDGAGIIDNYCIEMYYKNLADYNELHYLQKRERANQSLLPHWKRIDDNPELINERSNAV